MNGRSSRSHFIINFDVEIKFNMDYDETKVNQTSNEDLLKKNYYQVKKTSKIIFIDLAGSEKQKYNENHTM